MIWRIIFVRSRISLNDEGVFEVDVLNGPREQGNLYLWSQIKRVTSERSQVTLICNDVKNYISIKLSGSGISPDDLADMISRRIKASGIYYSDLLSKRWRDALARG